jgi:hypothetical protein
MPTSPSAPNKRMTGVNISTRFRAALAGGAVLALAIAASWAAARQTATPAPVPAPAPPAAAVAPLVKPVLPAAKPGAASAKPMAPVMWKNLTPPQQVALAPLMAEWDKMEANRKQKWLEVANKFASMKPEEQQRVHVNM